jgi:hypothetical protein
VTDAEAVSKKNIEGRHNPRANPVNRPRRANCRGSATALTSLGRLRAGSAKALGVHFFAFENLREVEEECVEADGIHV